MRVAVFCASGIGNNEIYLNEIKSLGKFFAKNNIELVYGGGKVGLMGAIADSVMQNGGKVYGVIPEQLEQKELSHTGITKLKVVKNMHERKAEMAANADAFVAFAGGAGTLEEIFEVWTWAQLGFHDKPCIFYNTNGYYDHLFDMINNMVKEGFLKEDYANMLIKTDNKEVMLKALKEYKAPIQKW
ncbi:TIGR00730 family Rossman fold protein [Malaciobacter molluscorum LMG 25693]|uniref:Cytokinin riboside 5'-monophosphate phosphoribohydrolase n=1 Tax=Malaciobacter molluscorum LMG 25693 TaxID=870501 RepID=A0A2G1DLQ6_9BACT|nr:TIGR00730 family Rossman fold protein [Malaciobacter molluscorum]AXX92172.1 putative Rossmann fold nucleotide-binding protein [Malaciobacter molluscorum LMG 25693]PHO19401.1 TIGR00730 family Rossman fold protein [Malaciobacter molluscorum LMG 25693]